jgi:hypothetical protein
MSQLASSGDLPKIIGNEERLYEGDLIPYFRVLFFKLSNSENPYHNFRHTLHVLWLCYDACHFYRKELSPRLMRSLLIAALFHDFDHPGHTPAGEDDPDRTNIPIAIDGLREHILPEDRALLREIEAIIEATHFPYKVTGEKLDLLGKIIRDADLAQALSSAWIQQVVIGLALEWGVKPLEVLRLQPRFLSSLRFNTEWRAAFSSRSSSREKWKKPNSCYDFLKQTHRCRAKAATVMITSAPKIHVLARDPHDHLVEMSAIIRARPALPLSHDVHRRAPDHLTRTTAAYWPGWRKESFFR